MNPGLERWPLPAIESAVAWPGFRAECVASVDSTNAELMRRLRAGDTSPALLVAEHQSAGRGRLGRPWHSGPSQSCLMFSLSLPLAPVDWSGLSLAIGVTLAQALQSPQAPDIRLKWPNDLWVDGAKLAGILIETAAWAGQRHVVVGAGINVDAPPSADFSVAPAWLRQWSPAAQAPQVLAQVVPALVAALQVFEREGFAPFRGGFAARDALLGQTVSVLSDGVEQWSGEGLGVDAQGALRLRTPQGVRTVSSGELSVRPQVRAQGEDPKSRRIRSEDGR